MHAWLMIWVVTSEASCEDRRRSRSEITRGVRDGGHSSDAGTVRVKCSSQLYTSNGSGSEVVGACEVRWWERVKGGCGATSMQMREVANSPRVHCLRVCCRAS